MILRTRPAHKISPVIAIKGRTFTPAATVRASTTVLTWHCPLSPAVIPVWGSPYLETPLAASAQVISGQCACILALDLRIGRSTASTSRFRPDVSRPPVSSPGPFRNRQLHIYDGWSVHNSPNDEYMPISFFRSAVSPFALQSSGPDDVKLRC